MTKAILFAAGLWLAFPPAFTWASTQEPTCVPTSIDAAKWPIKAIYLHGWYAPSGNNSQEERNRKALSDMGNRLHIRIAVPVSPAIDSNHRLWDSVSLTQIEALSVKACGGEALDDHRILIGYSNGGYAARRISNMDCERLKQHYTELMGIGAPFKKTPWGECIPHMNVNDHLDSPTARSLDYYVLGGKDHKIAPMFAPAEPPVREDVFVFKDNAVTESTKDSAASLVEKPEAVFIPSDSGR